VLYFFDQPWYRSINPSPNGGRSLLGDYPEAFGHLIICAAPETLPGSNKPFLNIDGKQARIFTVFKDVLSFWEYLRHWPSDRQNFFEVIPGSRNQKPHFDIDLSIQKAQSYPNLSLDEVATTILSQVVEGSLAIFKSWDLTPNLDEQLLVYSSHGAEKRSFHVVWNGYCHANNVEAEAFYRAVMNWISEHYGETYIDLVDRAVYSSLQNFRLLGSSKAGSDRIKMLHPELRIVDHTISHRYINPSAYHSAEQQAFTDLTESLLGDTNDCEILPRLVNDEQLHKNRSLHSSGDLTEDEVEECMALMRGKIDDAPFTVSAVTGSLIVLKREAPSWCPLCTDQQEPHQSQNPFMFVFDHAVYWNCRRNSQGQSLCLGYLFSRSRSAADDHPECENDYSQNKWEITWGVVDSPGVSIEIVDTPFSLSSANLAEHFGDSTSNAASNNLGVPAQEQIRKVTQLRMQQQQQKRDNKRYRSLSELISTGSFDPNGSTPTSSTGVALSLDPNFIFHSNPTIIHGPNDHCGSTKPNDFAPSTYSSDLGYKGPVAAKVPQVPPSSAEVSQVPPSSAEITPIPKVVGIGKRLHRPRGAP